jgi:hypothetical protein
MNVRLTQNTLIAVSQNVLDNAMNRLAKYGMGKGELLGPNGIRYAYQTILSNSITYTPLMCESIIILGKCGMHVPQETFVKAYNKIKEFESGKDDNKIIDVINLINELEGTPNNGLFAKVKSLFIDLPIDNVDEMVSNLGKIIEVLKTKDVFLGVRDNNTTSCSIKDILLFYEYLQEITNENEMLQETIIRIKERLMYVRNILVRVKAGMSDPLLSQDFDPHQPDTPE